MKILSSGAAGRIAGYLAVTVLVCAGACLATQGSSPTPSAREPQDVLRDARSWADHGHLSEAASAVRRYLGDHPESGKAHFLLGYILFRGIQANAEAGHEHVSEYEAPSAVADEKRRSALEASLAEYTAGARYLKPDAFDLKIVALDYILLRDYADADKWLTRSLEWNPADADGWYYLGRGKYNENRFAEAIRAFEECLKRDSRNVRAKNNLGLSLAALGRSSEAAAAYLTAIAWQADVAKKDPGPFLNLGSLYLEQNRPDAALPFLFQAAEMAPWESKAHELLGKTYSQLGQLSNAQAEFEAAVNLAPQSAPLHFMLGQVYRKEGFKEKAKVEIERSAALSDTQATHTGPWP